MVKINNTNDKDKSLFTRVLDFLLKHKNELLSKDTNTKLPFSIGVDKYINASTNGYYVDKTLLIKDVLDTNTSVFLFTRPRRFGKSLNMDMLKIFFEKTKKDTSIYFKDKKIWACGKKYQEHQGKYPVIYLTFKDIKFSTWESVYKNIITLIQAEFTRHSYLLDSSKLNKDDKNIFIKYKSTKLLSDESFNSLAVLSELLFKYHNKKTIIIIDEYDIPIIQGYIHGFYDEAIMFMRNFYSNGLKGNDWLKQSFVTGILRVAKESIFSGFNNPEINTILDKRYSQYFGFTSDEVKEMLKYYEAEDKYQEICEWYDGYRFGNTEIFNPWSVIYYLNTNKADAYWCNTSSNDIIGKLLKLVNEQIYEKLHNLLQGKTVKMYLNPNIVFPELERNVSSLFNLLLYTGYLKVINNEDLCSSGNLYDVAIPNKEIMYAYNNEIITKLNDGMTIELILNLKDMIEEGDTDKLKNSLEEFLRKSASFHDSNESFYQGVLLTLCVIAFENYEITSNRESGLGRYDIAMIPKKKSLPGIIIEVKNQNNTSENNLEDIATKALEQIEEKQYDTVMKQRDVMQVYKYGIAFSGKNVAIKKL